MSSNARRREQRQEQRQEDEEARLREWFRRVDAVMAGEVPASYQAGGWPFWTYSAVQVESLDWGPPDALEADRDDDDADQDDTRERQILPNTVRFPATCNTLTGLPNLHDHNDVTGSTRGSVAREHHVSLELLGDVLGAHDDAVEGVAVEGDAVAELDAPPSTLAPDDDALASTQTRMPMFLSPAYAQAVRSVYPARLVEALAIAKVRDRHVALGRVLREIRVHCTVTFYIRARLYLTWQDRGFGAYLRQRDHGIHHRGRGSRRAR